MAVDANVLIFERIKEELWNGKTMRAAVRVGFQRAFSAVFDSHFTTIVGAGVLYMLGTGTVKGFAFTLFWGTVVSLFTAVFITRFFVDALVDNEILTAPELYGVKRSEVGIFAKGARSGGVTRCSFGGSTGTSSDGSASSRRSRTSSSRSASAR